MHKVAFLDFVFENKADIHLAGCEFEIFPPATTAEQIIKAARGADILLMRDQFGKITAEVLDSCPPTQIDCHPLGRL